MDDAQSEKIAITAAALGTDVRAIPERASQLGFTGLLFDARGSGVDLTELSASGRREFLQLLSSKRQRLVGIRAGVGARGLGRDADVDQAISRIDRAMAASADLGAPLVCLDVGPLPESAEPLAASRPAITAAQAGSILLPDPVPTSPPPRPPVVSAEDLRANAHLNEVLAELGRRADRYSVFLALQSELSSFAALSAVLEAAGCPWFGVDLDPVAIVRDAWDLDQVFSRLGGLIRHVRARDAIGGAGGRTMPAPIGRGDLDWAKLISALHESDYSGWITIDPVDLPDRIAAAKIGLAHLAAIR